MRVKQTEEQKDLVAISRKYQYKINKFKRKLKLGSKVKYTRNVKYDKVKKIYTVLQKYDKFVVLQGHAYQTTARYEELLKNG